jgi:predicted TIM-barrel fold metal-dependent hydrolase
MDYSEFAPIPVVDGHIHLVHPDLVSDMRRVMDHVGLTAVNLVSVPMRRAINHNAALIDFKARYPGRAYISGALDYVQVRADLDQAPQTLADQVRRLQAVGFDGLKLLESKPTARQWTEFAVDGPTYAPMWAALEESRFPVVWHVADPEEFWDPEGCPDWARQHGWCYDEGDFTAKEQLYAEVEHVLTRYPKLRVIFAHFYFLSADLQRAAAFLDAHPGAHLDLAPGIEMFVNFSRDVEATRDFFIAYANRIVYGTDIGAGSAARDPAQGLDHLDAHGRTRLVRQFLESDRPFNSPDELGHGLGMDVKGLHGIALPDEELSQIYAGNFRNLFGGQPVALDRDAAIEELEWQASAIDALEGALVDSPARRVAQRLNH